MADVMETDVCIVVEKYRRTGSDKFRLKSKRDELVGALDETEIAKLVDLFFAKNIFNSEEKNIVTYEPVPEMKMRKLLDILEEKVVRCQDPPVLDVFLDFLKDCDYGELAEQLVNNEGIPEGYRDVEKAIELAEGMKLSDKILGGVVRQVGSSWLSVAHDLGVSNIKIENIRKDTHDDSYQQKFKVFNAWRQKSGFLPDSLVVLLQAFKDNYENCHVDWPGVCQYLAKNKDA